MLDVVLSGLLTGWAIAVPVGAVGALLVAVTARTSLAVGAAAALGIATVDGAYAAVAAFGGSVAAAALAPVAGPLRLASGLALLLVAAVTAAHALTRTGAVRPPSSMTARRAFLLFLGLTAVNPTTVVYFAAVVLGNRDLVSGTLEAVVFVSSAFAASAAWQLVLAGSGAGLGRAVTGPRGQLVTGLVSSAVIAGLALHTMLT